MSTRSVFGLNECVDQLGAESRYISVECERVGSVKKRQWCFWTSDPLCTVHLDSRSVFGVEALWAFSLLDQTTPYGGDFARFLVNPQALASAGARRWPLIMGGCTSLAGATTAPPSTRCGSTTSRGTAGPTWGSRRHQVNLAPTLFKGSI
eukprot:5485833-Pyramimonas_sp.AAC.1